MLKYEADVLKAIALLLHALDEIERDTGLTISEGCVWSKEGDVLGRVAHAGDVHNLDVTN